MQSPEMASEVIAANNYFSRKTSYSFVFLIIGSITPIAYIYYLVAKALNPHAMPFINYFVFTTIVVCCVVGGYQLYFWAQRNYLREPIFLNTGLDDLIPFYPSWSWCYSLVYYLAIGLVSARINSIEQGIYLIFGALVLLVIHCVIFVLFPVSTPPAYRAHTENSISSAFLKYVQSFDSAGNCFPSMHCALATYTAFSLAPMFGYYSYALIILIAMSCLFTKQHYIADIPPGIFLGWLIYLLINHICIF